MGHSYNSVFYHLVWSTKDRTPMINEHIKIRLYAYIKNIIKNYESDLISIGGTQDHVHLLIKSTVKKSLSDLICKIKANSSKFINELNPETKFAWQIGYGIFSVSISRLEIITNYIKKQEEHHKKEDFKLEFEKLLQIHKIKYEEKFLF